MKNMMSATLLTLMVLLLVSCSSSTPDPAADSSVAAPASSNATANAPAPKPAPSEPAAPAAPVVKMVAIPAETLIDVVLDSPLASNKSVAGDKFDATLAEPLMVNGATVLAKGTKFHGHVVSAEGSGRVKGLANISLVLTAVEHAGKATPITTKTWMAEAQSTKKKDAAKVGIAAGVGTAIGAIAGGGSGAAKGAAIGAGAGTGVVLATKGDEVELGPEQKIQFTVEKAFEVAAK